MVKTLVSCRSSQQNQSNDRWFSHVSPPSVGFPSATGCPKRSPEWSCLLRPVVGLWQRPILGRHLVGGFSPPLWKICEWVTVGMIPYMKWKKNVWNHQPATSIFRIQRIEIKTYLFIWKYMHFEFSSDDWWILSIATFFHLFSPSFFDCSYIHDLEPAHLSLLNDQHAPCRRQDRSAACFNHFFPVPKISSSIFHWMHIQLVGGFTMFYPSWKILVLLVMGRMTSHIWNGQKTCLKPPTSQALSTKTSLKPPSTSLGSPDISRMVPVLSAFTSAETSLRSTPRIFAVFNHGPKEWKKKETRWNKIRWE